MTHTQPTLSETMPTDTDSEMDTLTPGRTVTGTIDADLLDNAIRHLYGITPMGYLSVTEENVRITTSNDSLDTNADGTPVAGRVVLPTDDWGEYFDATVENVPVRFRSLYDVFVGEDHGDTVTVELANVDADSSEISVSIAGQTVDTPSESDSDYQPPFPEDDDPFGVIGLLRNRVEITDGYELRKWFRSEPDDHTHVYVTMESYSRSPGYAFSIQDTLSEEEKNNEDHNLGFEPFMVTNNGAVDRDSILDVETHDTISATPTGAESVKLSSDSVHNLSGVAQYRSGYLRSIFKHLLKEYTKGETYRIEFGNEFPIAVRRDFDGYEGSFDAVVAPRLEPN